MISNRHSKKVRNILAAQEAQEAQEARAGEAGEATARPEGARVAVCQMEGRRWATLRAVR